MSSVVVVRVGGRGLGGDVVGVHVVGGVVVVEADAALAGRGAGQVGGSAVGPGGVAIRALGGPAVALASLAGRGRALALAVAFGGRAALRAAERDVGGLGVPALDAAAAIGLGERVVIERGAVGAAHRGAR